MNLHRSQFEYPTSTNLFNSYSNTFEDPFESDKGLISPIIFKKQKIITEKNKPRGRPSTVIVSQKKTSENTFNSGKERSCIPYK